MRKTTINTFECLHKFSTEPQSRQLFEAKQWKGTAYEDESVNHSNSKHSYFSHVDRKMSMQKALNRCGPS